VTTQIEKITFYRLDDNFEPVEESAVAAQLNPTELTLSKAAQIAEIPIPGLDAPILQFVRGQNETLRLELFFDTTEDGMGEGATPVTEETDRFYELIKIDRQAHAPPILWVAWGEDHFPGSHLTGDRASQSRSGFQCVVQNVQQRFTLFSPEGVPLRATLTLELREYRTLDQQIEAIFHQSADHTRTRVVQRGDTLSGIAGELYGDPARWRAIAEHNGIVDPLAVEAGTALEIPPLPGGRRTRR
jgi:nucleoid-associated protein YgaU